MPLITILLLQLLSEVREKLPIPFQAAQDAAAQEYCKAGAHFGLSEASVPSVWGWHQDLLLPNFSSSGSEPSCDFLGFSLVDFDGNLRRTLPRIPFFWTEHMVSQVDKGGRAGHGS